MNIFLGSCRVFARYFSQYLEDGESSMKDIANALQIRLPDYDKLQNCIRELSEKAPVLMSPYQRKQAEIFYWLRYPKDIFNNKPVTVTNLKCDIFGLAEHMEGHFKAK
ncbi:MAG: hypothetical protein IPN13_10885 [Bacteroidetes bacterium]|nr:hypothetical protein [Bacteroidota bacterium]